MLFTALSIALAVTYLIGTRRLRGGWPLARTACWLAGCAVLLVATSSGVGRYAPAMFSVEAVDHMLIGMLAPMLLALGAPLTLAARTLQPASLAGPAEWLFRARGSRWARALTHPVVITTLFVGMPFLLYFTVAYDLSVRYHWAHLAMDLLFLAVGWLFAWTMLGSDPTPVPAASLVRVGLLLAAMPFDIVFAAAILATNRVIGNGSASANLYQAVALPWVPSLLADQRLGAYLALLASELVMFTMLIIVVVRWRPAAPDHDYRQLLEEISRRQERSAPADAA